MDDEQKRKRNQRSTTDDGCASGCFDLLWIGHWFGSMDGCADVDGCLDLEGCAGGCTSIIAVALTIAFAMMLVVVPVA